MNFTHFQPNVFLTVIFSYLYPEYIYIYIYANFIKHNRHFMSCHVMAHEDEEVGMIPPPLN